MATGIDATQEQTRIIDKLKQQLSKNPLPVLKKTVARIVTLASTVKSDIGELAQTILQDQSFTAKVLAVANSPYYQSPERIVTITRAIIQIGYSTLRDIAIAAEFTEMGQKRLPAGVNLQRLLAKAFVAAQQAKALGEAVHLPQAEELFTATLLQSIGDFAFAYYMPKEYKRIEELMSSQGITYDDAYQQVLGVPPADLTAIIMQACQIPEEMVTHAPDWSAAKTWTARERKDAVVVVGNEVATNYFLPQSDSTNAQLNKLLGNAGRALDLPLHELEHLIADAFNRACSLGQSLEIDPACFLPQQGQGQGSHNGTRHQLVETCAKFAEPKVETKAIETPPPPPPDSVGSAGQLVIFLTELTNQVMKNPNFNSVLTCMLEGLHRGVGFDHAFVVLLVPGKSLAMGRYGVGPDAPSILPSFAVSTNAEHNMLAHCIATNTAVRLNTDEEPPFPFPPAVIDAIRPTAVALGPLYTPTRTIGIIWADRVSGEIDEPMWNAFNLFLMQANLALMRLSMKS